VTRECRQQLERLSARPCVALLCGNSEGAQQAAMWGAPRERWSHGLFEHLLPQIVAELTPQLPYWPSSAYGGAFPHQGNVGTTSYYGVGAYLRPLTDARRAEIRFASECLGLANVPEEEMLDALGTPGTIKVHSPLWKARVPRDLGAGWDFDDVRDHYLREIFGIDALAVRYADHDRYLQLSRAVSAEVMSAAFREWRRGRSTCNGALIWFLRDLWPGAGWGIVDASGAPKSAYYSLKRLLQSRAVFLSDEGGNGIFAHVANETALVLEATLEVLLIPTRSSRVIRKLLPIEVPARQTVELPIATALEGFEDLSYAYRFGPPQYEAIMLSLLDATGGRLAHDFYFPLGHGAVSHSDLGLAATAQQQPDGNAMLEVTAEKLARFVTVRVPGYRADDQYFHLAPATPHRVHLRRLDARAEPSGEVAALNGSARKIVFTR
jgi:beta-mannosidase